MASEKQYMANGSEAASERFRNYTGVVEVMVPSRRQRFQAWNRGMILCFCATEEEAEAAVNRIRGV